MREQVNFLRWIERKNVHAPENAIQFTLSPRERDGVRGKEISKLHTPPSLRL
jgi:hypothetical protein